MYFRVDKIRIATMTTAVFHAANYCLNNHRLKTATIKSVLEQRLKETLNKGPANIKTNSSSSGLRKRNETDEKVNTRRNELSSFLFFFYSFRSVAIRALCEFETRRYTFMQSCFVCRYSFSNFGEPIWSERPI